MQKVNSGTRLYSVLSEAAKQEDSYSSVDVWARVFQIAAPQVLMKSFQVSEMLNLIAGEIDILLGKMRATGTLSDETYIPQIDGIRNALSPMLLGAQWSTCKQYLGPTALLALKVCADLLPHEEDEIEASDLINILSDLDALQHSLVSSKLPPRLRETIERHANQIRTSISAYKVVGAKALKEAADTAVISVLENQTAVRDNSTTEEVGLFGRIVKKATSVANGVIRADKVTEIGTKLWSLLENALK